MSLALALNCLSLLPVTRQSKRSATAILCCPCLFSRALSVANKSTDLTSTHKHRYGCHRSLPWSCGGGLRRQRSTTGVRRQVCITITKSISKWIVGKADKEFVVKFRFTEPLSKDFYGIAPSLGVDGIFMSTPPGSFLTTDTIYKSAGFQFALRDVPKESEDSDTPRPSMIFEDLGPGEH